ncbi:unnamed protein product [Closterium sp. NIES-54]
MRLLFHCKLCWEHRVPQWQATVVFLDRAYCFKLFPVAQAVSPPPHPLRFPSPASHCGEQRVLQGQATVVFLDKAYRPTGVPALFKARLTQFLRNQQQQ